MLKTAPLVHVKAGPQDGLEEGQFTAYASVFDVKDSYGDVVRKGAFTETLAEWAQSPNVIPVLYGHDMKDPDFNVGYVVDAVEDDHGLLVTGQIDLDGPKGRQTYRLLKGRRVSQMSFAYDVVEGGAHKDDEFGDYYSLDKLKLYEVSIVPIGANQETEILAVKHLTDAVQAGRLSSKALDALVEARSAIDSVLAVIGGNGEDQNGKASDTEPATPDPSSDGLKDTGPEPTRGSSVDTYLAVLNTIEREMDMA